MFVEGRIIEFLDSDQLRFGYVRKQERDRLHIIDPRGRNLSVSGDRVVVVHQPASEADFPSLAREISEKSLRMESQVDVELLWQSVHGAQRELALAELAGLFFSEPSAEAVSGLFRALSADTLFFRRRGAQFLPKTSEQVSAERTRRLREREREAMRQALTESLRRLMRGKPVDGTPGVESLLDRIESWLKRKTGDEAGQILEQIAGAAGAKDAAYDILVRAGRVDPKVDRFLVIAGIDERFPSAAVERAIALQPYTHVENRADFRGMPAATIDDEDTLEVDDALTLERVDGDLVVGVHIADVSAFVEKADALDAEAARRSSTIYLPTATVRMFPDRLSTELASLRQDSDRPAFTVEVRFDRQFNRLGYRIALSTIRVGRRLSYDEADQLIESDPDLQTLHALAMHLQQQRAARGAITFRRPELKIRVEQDGIHIKKINPNAPSRVLVSEMMILANGLAADFASVNSLPVIFRTQEPREAVVDETPVIEALAFERLRKTFKRSRLSLTPGLHSGLGLTAYTQVSSPIRRYADLVTQRQFTAMLAGAPVPYSREELLRILASAEAAELEIRSIEERSTTYWLLRYLESEQASKVLNAVILDQKGAAELEDYYVRGKLTGPMHASPGAVVQVKIESVDPLKGDLRLKPA